MTRHEMEERLVDFLYDELDAEERARFEASLPAHPELAAEVAAHTSTRSLLADSGALAPVRMPPGLLDGVMREARLVAAPPAEVTPTSWLDKLLALFMQPAMAVAMLAVLVAGAGVFLARNNAPESVMADSVAMQAEPNTAASPAGAPPPELAEARLEERKTAEAEEAPQAPADDGAEGVAAAADAPAAAPTAADGDGQAFREVAKGSIARLDTKRAGLAEADEAEAPPMEWDASNLGQQAGADKAQAQAEPRRLAAKSKSAPAAKLPPGVLDSAREQTASGTSSYGGAARKEDADDRMAEEQAAAAESYRGVPQKGELKPASAPVPSKPAEYPATKDGRLNQVQTATEKKVAKPADPMDEVREEAAQKARDAERGKYLLAQVDKFAAAGREDLVDQTLELLEKVPGWENVARGRRSAAVSRRSKGAGGGPALAPSKKSYDFEDAAPEPAAEPAQKK